MAHCGDIIRMSETEEAGASYPLHRMVWDNDHQNLESALKNNDHNKEECDPRGRTPLMLAVTLGHLECIRLLLDNDANVNVVNKGGWTLVQEAVSTGDPELLQLVLKHRDRQRYTSRIAGIPGLLEKLKESPDFYVEMKWEFTSWIPFLSRMCPSDTYKVYKQGSRVRVDTTLLGFENTNWIRGNRTYIFSGHENGATMYDIDHDTKVVYCEKMKLLRNVDDVVFVTSSDAISARLTTPLVMTFLDTEKINFERSKGGFWGWGGSDRKENISGYECNVFEASNVEVVTKTRTEHLTEEDKKRAKSKKNQMLSYLGISEEEVKMVSAAACPESSENFSANNPCCITQEEYFSNKNLEGRDIGRPKEQSSKIQKFQGKLWLSEECPLSLQEQVMPIVNLMAGTNTHFQKLKDFITCSIPAGFPVKIEIPLFHVINARITFGNIFGLDNKVDGVTIFDNEGDAIADGSSNRKYCVVNEDTFEIPSDYSKIGGQSMNHVRRQYEDDDDQLLQYAIQQSLIETPEGANSNEEVDIWEALQVQGPPHRAPPKYEKKKDKNLDMQIQKAIELSLAEGENSEEQRQTLNSNEANAQSTNDNETLDSDLQLAIQLSQQALEEAKRQQEEDDEIMKKILALSLQEQ